MPRRLLAPNRLGYRGASLLMYGLIFFITGLPLLLGVFIDFAPVQQPASIGLPVWAGGFVVSGILAILSAFRRTPQADKIGFTSLSAVGWSWVAYGVLLQLVHWAVLIFNWHWLPHIGTVGWGSIIANSVIMTKVWIDSGWNEPTVPLNLEPIHPRIQS